MVDLIPMIDPTSTCVTSFVSQTNEVVVVHAFS